MLSNKVAGNGLTLGFTNGVQNLGIALVSSNNVGGYVNVYGNPVGTSIGGDTVGNKSLGITTDTDKSGIVVKADESLSYYIRY